MANPLYESMKPQPQNPMQMVQSLKNNPAEFLRQRGISLPQGVDVHNPQAIINSLLQSGRISGGRYQQVLQMMGARK